MEKAIGSCAQCGYPLAAAVTGEKVHCPLCSTNNIAQVIDHESIWPPLAVLTAMAAIPLWIGLRRRK